MLAGEGGSIPVMPELEKLLGAPVFGLPSSNAHAPDEWLDLELFHKGAGEAYEATTGTWAADAPRSAWLVGTLAAWQAGAKIVGGCCRVGPDKIAELRRRLEAGTRTEVGP